MWLWFCQLLASELLEVTKPASLLEKWREQSLNISKNSYNLLNAYAGPAIVLNIYNALKSLQDRYYVLILRVSKEDDDDWKDSGILENS